MSEKVSHAIIMHDSIYIEFLRWQDYRDGKQISVASSEDGVGWKEGKGKDTGEGNTCPLHC